MSRRPPSPPFLIRASGARQQRDMLAAGAAAYLTKPLELDKLMRLIDETLSSGTPATF